MNPERGSYREWAGSTNLVVEGDIEWRSIEWLEGTRSVRGLEILPGLSGVFFLPRLS